MCEKLSRGEEEKLRTEEESWLEADVLQGMRKSRMWRQMEWLGGRDAEYFYNQALLDCLSNP